MKKNFHALADLSACNDRKEMPKGDAETRLSLRGRVFLYLYCNKHGLMKLKSEYCKPPLVGMFR